MSGSLRTFIGESLRILKLRSRDDDLRVRIEQFAATDVRSDELATILRESCINALSNDRTSVYLGDGAVAVRTCWENGWVVVPSWNVDVAVGPLRDGVIEPATTRCVREILREGDIYFNAGANFGYYIALGGARVGASGRVYGAEPNPHIIPFLLKTLFWAGVVGRTKLYARALGGEIGQSLRFEFDPQYLGGGRTRSAGSSVALPSLKGARWSHENLHLITRDDGQLEPERGMMVEFETKTTTIDHVLRAEKSVRLIHLDIEGAEPHALHGAFATIERSPELFIITEWTAEHYANGSQGLRRHFDDVWSYLSVNGFQVRHISPLLASDGGLSVSAPLSFEHMTQFAVHADYVWVRKGQDPWP